MNHLNFPKVFDQLPPGTISAASQTLRKLESKSVFIEANKIKFHDKDRQQEYE